jgi:hypothetical protein
MLWVVMPMIGAKALSRWLAILSVLVLVALLRAERGVAELQGRNEAPGRILWLSPEQGGTWAFSLLGLEGRVPARVVLLDSGRPLLDGAAVWRPGPLGQRAFTWVERIQKALP